MTNAIRNLKSQIVYPLGKTLIVVSVFFIYASQAGVRQKELGTQVSEAVALFSREPQLARKQLSEIGPSAFPLILRILHDDAALGLIKKTFLISVIAHGKTRESALTLIELLTDADSYVRGLAASYLAKRMYRPAIGPLIKLVEDKGVFITTIKTDPDREEPELVRDKAMEALQAITGRRMAIHATRDERARAWLRWWQKQQRSKETPQHHNSIRRVSQT